MSRIAIVDGVRTPFVKSGGAFNFIPAYELGRIALRELIERTNLSASLIDHVVIGNVANPPEAANVARVIALQAGIPQSVPAYTISRNCASGMEAIVDAARLIQTGEASAVIAGGVESMSNIPFLFQKNTAEIFAKLAIAKTLPEKLFHFLKFRPRHFAPVIGVVAGLNDPVCGLNMGQTAEVLAKEYHISRESQDAFAIQSHQRAVAATESGKLAEEIVPVPIPPRYSEMVTQDMGMRKDTSLEKLAKLRPLFDRKFGTVTAGNSSMVTDGVAAVLVMAEEKAKALGYTPLGYIRSYASAGLDPAHMGLGPIFATAKTLKKAGLSLNDIGLIEINEAFAAQVLAVLECFASREFAKKHLDQEEAVGEIDPAILNVNGGAIALGHPVGTSGTRLVLTLLKEMKRRDVGLGLATLCVGGGQGEAVVVEQ